MLCSISKGCSQSLQKFFAISTEVLHNLWMLFTTSGDCEQSLHRLTIIGCCSQSLEVVQNFYRGCSQYMEVVCNLWKLFTISRSYSQSLQRLLTIYEGCLQSLEVVHNLYIYGVHNIRRLFTIYIKVVHRGCSQYL